MPNSPGEVKGSNDMGIPRVFVDTTVLKFSATELLRYAARNTSVEWGGTIVEGVVHDLVEIHPNDFIKNPALKSEAELLPRAAELGKTGAVEYVMGTETLVESWNQRNMDSESGRFYGAPIAIVDSPIKHSRVVAGLGIDRTKEQFRFLTSIEDKRFLELQKITGAYQGERPASQCQLMDAFHVW